MIFNSDEEQENQEWEGKEDVGEVGWSSLNWRGVGGFPNVEEGGEEDRGELREIETECEVIQEDAVEKGWEIQEQLELLS